MINSDKLLKSSGQLRADKQFAYGGENCKGMFGINTKRISGVGLNDHQTALVYALGLVLQIDETATLCASAPQRSIELYTKTINGWIQSKEYWSLYITYTNQSIPTALTNFHRHMKILWSLNPQQFEEQLLPKVYEMLSQLESFINSEQNTNPNTTSITPAIAISLKEKLFMPILTFKETLQVYTEEDKRIITEFYPVIFGTGQLKLAEKPVESSKEKIALRVPDSNTNEYAYEGSLKLGDELPFMFVPQSTVLLTKERLIKANIHNVHVTNIEALRIAPQFEQFKKHKARSKVW